MSHSVTVVMTPSTNTVRYRLRNVCSRHRASTDQSPPLTQLTTAAPRFTTSDAPVSTAAGMMFMVMS